MIPDDLLTAALREILLLAEERQCEWPLHVAIEMADGQGAAYVFPAPGELAILIDDRIDPAELYPLPYKVTVREWDQAAEKPKAERAALRLQIVGSEEDGRIVLSILPMRSTLELIAELDHEATLHYAVLMPVAFDNTTIWVKADDPDRQRVLDDAVRVGGTPMGLMAADYAEEHLTVITRPFPEHAHREEEVRKYLHGLSNEWRELLTQAQKEWEAGGQTDTPSM